MPPRGLDSGVHFIDRKTALMIKDTGEGGFDFFVNMDNLYLQTEIKASRSEEPKLLEARYKYGLVLVGLSLIKDNSNGNGTKHTEEVTPIHEQVAKVTSAISPVLLPMIENLGELELPE